MITYNQKLKIQEETRNDYADAGLKTLKGLIFLTGCVRNMCTRSALFIGLAIPQFIVAIFLFYRGFGAQIFLIAGLVHFLVYTFLAAWAEKDGIKSDFEEQNIIYQELKAMLTEKQNGSGD
jgi:hypothetical protein